MHSVSLLVLAAGAALVAASPLSHHSDLPILQRRQLNPISFGLGTAAMNQANQNTNTATQMQSNILDLQQECAQLEGREQMIQRGQAGPVLERRQLGTVFGVKSKHKNEATGDLINTMNSEVADLRQRTDVLLNAERLGAGSPFVNTDTTVTGPRLVRRIFFSGTITAIQGRKGAKKNAGLLQTLQGEVSQLQADLARVRAAQDVRLRVIGIANIPTQIVHDIQVNIARPIPRSNQWGSNGGVMAASSDRGRNYGSSNQGRASYGSSNQGRNSYGSSNQGNLPSNNGRSAYAPPAY